MKTHMLRAEMPRSPVNLSQAFPQEDDLFRTWLRGFREHQSFDPECAACGGTGRHKPRKSEQPDPTS